LQQAADQNDANAAFVLGFASETGRGQPRDPQRASELYRRCGADNLFAQKGLARLALATSAPIAAGTVTALARAAMADDAEACWYLAFLHAAGRNAARDESKARALLQQAAKLGLQRAAAAASGTPLPAFAPLAGSEMVLPPFATAYPL
jgi:TPR repeat protein